MNTIFPSTIMYIPRSHYNTDPFPVFMPELPCYNPDLDDGLLCLVFLGVITWILVKELGKESTVAKIFCLFTAFVFFCWCIALISGFYY